MGKPHLFKWTDVIRIMRQILYTRKPPHPAHEQYEEEWQEAIISLVILAENYHESPLFYWNKRFTILKPRFISVIEWDTWDRNFRRPPYMAGNELDLVPLNQDQKEGIEFIGSLDFKEALSHLEEYTYNLQRVLRAFVGADYSQDITQQAYNMKTIHSALAGISAAIDGLGQRLDIFLSSIIDRIR